MGRWAYNSGMPGTGVGESTKVERRIPMGSLVWVILIVSSMSTRVEGSQFLVSGKATLVGS